MPAKLEFEDLSFARHPDLDDYIRCSFMSNYYFDVLKSDLSDIGEFTFEKNTITFDCSEKRANNKFSRLINRGLDNLYHKIRNKKTLYIHQNSGIPLIGTNEFGIIDRGSNIIEIKPMSGCNLNCTFCSVSEGINDKIDVVLEEEYLISELKKLAQIKENSIEINIGPQGEPLLYPKIIKLIEDMKSIKNIKVISINTNGLLLNPKLIDALKKAGLDRINLSLHALDKKIASKLADAPFNVDYILKMIKYCEGKIDILLTPVLIPGHNDDEIEKLVELSKTIKNNKYPTIGVQNYLTYKGGRKIAKEKSWDDFYKFLKDIEKRQGVPLTMSQEIFNIKKDNTLKKPFKKNQIIEAEIICKGRAKNEYLAVSNDRVITVINSKKDRGKVKIKLIRDKHNIFSGVSA